MQKVNKAPLFFCWAFLTNAGHNRSVLLNMPINDRKQQRFHPFNHFQFSKLRSKKHFVLACFSFVPGALAGNFSSPSIPTSPSLSQCAKCFGQLTLQPC